MTQITHSLKSTFLVLLNWNASVCQSWRLLSILSFLYTSVRYLVSWLQRVNIPFFGIFGLSAYVLTADLDGARVFLIHRFKFDSLYKVNSLSHDI